jgi:hypothetical protein
MTNPDNSLDCLFSDDDIISSYSDADALSDGILVDITEHGLTAYGIPVNRLTATLCEEMLEQLDRLPTPSGVYDYMYDCLRVEIATAQKQPGEDGRILLTISGWWLVLNEMNQFTLMKPEDY